MNRGGLILLLLFVLSPVFGSQSQLKQGNRHFRSGNYEKALKLYDDALIDSPHSPVLHYNAGAAAYQAGDPARAEKEFTESAQAAFPELRNLSQYNRGNALFRQQRYDDAIEAYKEALRINPADGDAKYNLGVARRAKQNPPKQQPQSGKGNPQKSDQKQAGSEGDNKGKGDEKKERKQDSMSREDAERLLSAASAGERKKSDQKAVKEQKAGVDEDW